MAIQVRKPERTMAVWEPFRELEDMERRFENIFGRPFFSSFPRWMPSGDGQWMPAIDVIEEEEDKFVVKAALPDMKEEDIEVSMVGNALTIRGEQKKEAEVEKKNYHYREIQRGSFYRSITMPDTVMPTISRLAIATECLK